MCLDTGALPDTLPSWSTEQDRDVFTREGERPGFRGGLNGYRNRDRFWELTPCLSRATPCQPALLIAGGCDPVITMMNREEQPYHGMELGRDPALAHDEA
jgi:hypothetical protein